MVNDGDATFGYYMIGVFDVLGQSRKLREQTKLPLVDDDAERQRMVQNLKDTAGVVIRFRQLFKTFFEGATQHSGRADLLPAPQRAEMLAAMSSNVMCWGVSDSIFVAVPLAWTRHPAAGVAPLADTLPTPPGFGRYPGSGGRHGMVPRRVPAWPDRILQSASTRSSSF